MEYTVAEAQKMLGYKSRQAINALIERGILKPSRLSPIYLIPLQQIKRLMRLKKGRKHLFSRRKRLKKS